MAGESRIDPVMVSVIDNGLDAITAEMGRNLLRTSRSPILSEARDIAVAIFDKKLRLVCEKLFVEVQMGTASFAVRTIAEYYEGDINEGDVFLLNDPYKGKNNHLQDYTVVKPVFNHKKLVFWIVTKGHLSDTGGKGILGYNPMAVSIWEEGFRIPPVKLYDRGNYQRNVWNMIMINVRHVQVVEGDINCLVGAAALGERKLLKLTDKYGLENINKAFDYLISATEHHVRQEIRKIPNGTYYAERFMDNDGFNRDKMVKIGLKLIVEDESIIYDYSSSDRQVKGYVNSTIANTYSSSYLALFATIDLSIRHNEGAFRPIKIIAPEGSVVNCTEPAPCSACTICSAAAIVEVVWLALFEAVPERTQAAWARSAAPVSMGFNNITGKFYSDIHLFPQGGAGAKFGFDGLDHVGVFVRKGSQRASDPELHEIVNPFFILDYEYLQDSPGAGKWRGGMGTKFIIRVETDKIICNNFGDGLLPDTAPYGLSGGKGANPSKLRVIKANGEIIDPGVHSFFTLSKGDIYEVFETGGGGYGDPFERPIDMVYADVRDELISIDRALNDYGVVIDPQTLKVDYSRTEDLRSNNKKADI